MRTIILLAAIALSACAQRTQNLKVYDRTTPTNRLRIQLDGTSGVTITDYDTPSNYTATLTASSFEWLYGATTKATIQPGNNVGSALITLHNGAGTLTGLTLDGDGQIEARTTSHAYVTTFKTGDFHSRNMEISGDVVQSVVIENTNVLNGDTASVRRYINSTDASAACPNKFVGELTVIDRGASSRLAIQTWIYPCSAADTRNYFEFMGTLRPMSDNVWGLGTTSLRWSDVFATQLSALGGTIRLLTAGGSLRVSTSIDGSGNGKTDWYNSGGSTIATIDSSGANAATLKVAGTTVVNGSLGATFNQLTVNGTSFMRDVTPVSLSTYGLGTISAPWRYLYMEGANGNIHCGGECSPIGDNNDSWGSSSKRWAEVVGVQAVFNGYTFNGTAGASKTVTVRDAAGTGTCTLVFTVGGYTGGTC